MRHIAFDFDGTIGDSNFAICEAMERACIRHGAEYIGDAKFTKFIGQDLDICIKNATDQILTKAQIEGVARSYRETFKYELVKPFIGIEEVLQECIANGDKLAIATSRRTHSLKSLLDTHDLSHYFEFAVCGDQVQNPKPHVEMLLEISKRFGIDSSELIVVGDTKWDAEMASNVGAEFLGVTWGSHDEAQLYEAGASMIFDTPEELQKYFAAN